MSKTVIPYKLDKPDPSIESVEAAFKNLFKDSLSVETCNIRAGKSSAIIYVPKEFKDKIATVIIWDKPVKYYEVEPEGDMVGVDEDDGK
jgi:hypothetical protein